MSTSLHDLVMGTFATIEAKDLETMMSLFAGLCFQAAYFFD